MFEDFTLWNGLTIASLVVNLITMILVIVSLTKKRSIQVEQQASAQVAASRQTKPSEVSGVVFCRNCGNQYDSSRNSCPSCQAPR
jgi:membrane protease subunit (stomatin/prohibitin family)